MINVIEVDNGWTAEIDGLTAFVPNDPQNEHCRQILALIEGGLVVSHPAPVDPRATATLSKIDFCRALYDAQILPADLVVDAALGKWPATFEAAISALSEAARVDAKLAWAGAVSVGRLAPLFLQLLSFFAAKQGLNAGEAEALGDKIFGQSQ